ncbi:phage major capsid protein [Clostridium botulinum]|uniref:Phage major capsid protein, HK97 family n=1 Tax=Clostridium botulinum (strain Eklund 17B / Type B) TaxID=935198 RepID=B2THE2_CLOBB|nr:MULTISPECIES: phage major capsid protein [Clostridium]ACD23048.1 phage major capsid protein, HK97 family [Clostridium botulinum B str. Eklund 17B (NRP)]MBY6977423.1 phage major capsid protein [Clostridium botulinum]MBY7001978.1 phage major capsid protein [Clostridium botulinum]MCR1275575.1 phage major capsid protein [Clostridium botulinum]MCS6131414.1 phage major capsid protein [Clostridium botulinum]
MKFKTISEAFNYYRNHNTGDIEKRAAEIGNLINTDPNVDMESLNIELEGLKQAKTNIEERSQQQEQFNPVAGMNFNNNSTEVPKGDIFASNEYRSAFFKNMLGQRLTDMEQRTFKRAMEIVDTEKRADAFSTTTSAAAVLPTQTLNEVISKARTMGGLISSCRNFNIPTNLSVPIGTPSTKAAWHVEGAAVETKEPAISSVSFAAYEIIKVMSLSAAAKKMSIQAFESYVTEELTNCVMETIADSLVNGTGSAQGTGILTGITWNISNSFTFAKAGVPVYTDFTKMVAMLKRGYGAGAKFAMNNSTLYNLVYSLVDLNGRPIFIADPKNEEIGYILGKPVVIDDNIADDVVLLGNFNYMGYNIPQGIIIETSRDSSFKSGLIDYRALAIADTKPLVDETFVKLSRASS